MIVRVPLCFDGIHTLFVQRTIQNDFIKVFQIIQLGIFLIERLKDFLSPEESLFEGSQGRFRSVSIRFDMEPDRDEFAIKSFLGIAVSVGQI